MSESEVTYHVLLPSFRVAEFIELTLSRSFDITEAVSQRIGNNAAAATANQQLSREKVLTCLRRITRQPVTLRFKEEPAVGPVVEKVQKMLAQSADGGDPVAALRALHILTAPFLEGIRFADEAAMIDAARAGTDGGGWINVSYQEMCRASSDAHFDKLFDRYRSDFYELASFIDQTGDGGGGAPKPEAAAVVRSRIRVMAVSG